MTILPNPSKDAFTVSFEELGQNMEVEVFTQDGRRVLSRQNVSGQFQFGSDLPAGMYYVRIFNDAVSEVQKVIKY